MEIKSISGFSEERLIDILEIEKKCFPKSWQYDDSKKYYKMMLEEKENIHIFAESGGIVAGYLLARPYNKAINEIYKHDTLLDKNKKGFSYLETIGVIKDFRGSGLASKMILKFIQESKKKGIIGFSVHARVVNKFNKKIKSLFPYNILKVRKIDGWFFGGNEPYEYIEFSI